MGTLVGIFGIIIALFVSDGKVKETETNQNITAQKIVSGELKKCPHCAEVIKAEARVCRFCGRDIV
jgi:hypothetical protein